MKNKIRQYNRKFSIIANFSEKGDNFTLDVPHKNKWLNLISYFRRRGFIVTKDPHYEEEYKILSKYHKIGRKGEVVVLLEITSSSIDIKFGHEKNLWDCGGSFWDYSEWDKRYTKLSYLENKRCELEINRCLEYLVKWDFEFSPCDSTLTDTERIIKNNKNNTHIHGGDINSLEDIGKSIAKDSYNYNRNSNDANGVKILCGDTKYFYDYDKKLARGIAYHNINNMWWIMVNGKRFNVSSFNLFDFSSELSRKKALTQQQQVQRWKDEVKKAEKKRNYKKAEALWKKIDNFTLYNVWSLKRNSWYASGSSGYVSRQEDAGVYTKREIDSDQSYYNNNKTTKAILIEK